MLGLERIGDGYKPPSWRVAERGRGLESESVSKSLPLKPGTMAEKSTKSVEAKRKIVNNSCCVNWNLYTLRSQATKYRVPRYTTPSTRKTSTFPLTMEKRKPTHPFRHPWLSAQ